MGRNTGCLSSPPHAAHLDAVAAAQVPRSRCGDTAVHQDQLQPAGDPLLTEVTEHELAGPVLVHRRRYGQRADWKPGHVDGDDSLGALRAPVGSTAVMEGGAAVGGSARQMGVDDHHGRRRLGPPLCGARGLMQHG